MGWPIPPKDAEDRGNLLPMLTDPSLGLDWAGRVA